MKIKAKKHKNYIALILEGEGKIQSLETMNFGISLDHSGSMNEAGSAPKKVNMEAAKPARGVMTTGQLSAAQILGQVVHPAGVVHPQDILGHVTHQVLPQPMLPNHNGWPNINPVWPQPQPPYHPWMPTPNVPQQPWVNGGYEVTTTAESKMSLAKKAIEQFFAQLKQNDFLSIAGFSEIARVFLGATQKTNINSELFNSTLSKIQPTGSTNLFDGWRCAGSEVTKNLDPKNLNRVLLFTDGQANAGITSPDQICSKVKDLAKAGISTSAFGVGLSFNEELLQAIADAGDGNYYYIESGADFSKLLLEEQENGRTLYANQVRLSLKTKIKDCLNDLSVEGDAYILPNVRNGKEVFVMFETEKSITKLSGTLRFMRNGKFEEVSFDVKVEKDDSMEVKKDELMIAREKKKAIKAMDVGDYASAKSVLYAASQNFATCAAASASANYLADNMDNDLAGTRKMAHYTSYRSAKSRE